MATLVHNRKTYADVSSSNSFAGLGFVGGALIGVGTALSDLAFPGLSTNAADWGVNFLLGGVAGAAIGCVIGAIADRADPRSG